MVLLEDFRNADATLLLNRPRFMYQIRTELCPWHAGLADEVGVVLKRLIELARAQREVNMQIGMRMSMPFQTLALRFQSLQGELEETHGIVLRGLILIRMRATLDAMWKERRASGNRATADLDEKEALLKKAG